MPRKDLKAKDRRTGPGPDPIYKSTIIAMLVNKLIEGGKKTTAEKIIYGAMERIKEKKLNNVHEHYRCETLFQSCRL
jgi:ribosomal protein S7